ncbi:MAG: GPW/gp25 family protein [Acidobacteriota bacterium]
MAKVHLGRGWRFPVEPDGQGRLRYDADEDKIQQAVLVILGTTRGERVMRPEFGARLRELVFAPITSSTKGLLARAVTDALVKWEPRVDVLGVNVNEQSGDPGTLNVNIEYRVRATNSVFNLVYPFYLREGGSAATQTV